MLTEVKRSATVKYLETKKSVGHLIDNMYTYMHRKLIYKHRRKKPTATQLGTWRASSPKTTLGNDFCAIDKNPRYLCVYLPRLFFCLCKKPHSQVIQQNGTAVTIRYGFLREAPPEQRRQMELGQQQHCTVFSFRQDDRNCSPGYVIRERGSPPLPRKTDSFSGVAWPEEKKQQPNGRYLTACIW